MIPLSAAAAVGKGRKPSHGCRARTSRIVEGCVFEREENPSEYRLKVWEFPGVGMEVSLQPVYHEREVGALPQAALDRHGEFVLAESVAAMAGWDGELGFDAEHDRPGYSLYSEAEAAERARKNRCRAGQRAKQNLRHHCKAKKVDTLLTFTYRENMLDHDRLTRDMDVVLKRMRRALGGMFAYVRVFEVQERGAWHCHLAIKGLRHHYTVGGCLVRSYDLLRSLWRAVVGADNGTVNVVKGKGAKGNNSAAVASYLGKYLSKDLGADAPAYRNRYAASEDTPVPEPVVMRLPARDLIEALQLALDLLAPEVAAASVLRHNWLPRGGYYLALPVPSS